MPVFVGGGRGDSTRIGHGFQSEPGSMISDTTVRGHDGKAHMVLVMVPVRIVSTVSRIKKYVAILVHTCLTQVC